MKLKILILLAMLLVVGSIFAEVTIDSEASIYYTYGIAEESQVIPGTQPGVYIEKKNSYNIDGKILIKGTVENKFDMIIDLSTKSITGSPYIPLQLSPSNPSDFTVGLSNLYGVFYLSDLLFNNMELLGTNVEMKLKMGKFGMSASDFSYSRFGLDSVLGSINMANSAAVNLETAFIFNDIKQYIYGERANIKLDIAAGGLFGEDLQRLYDIDGGISEHGKIVVGEYSPVLYVNIGLNNYVLESGVLSVSASYVMNGDGIYSGNSIGASAKFEPEIVVKKLLLPISIDFAMYEKNIDALGGSSDNSLTVDTTDFRETIRVGAAVGLQYLRQTFGQLGRPSIDFDVTLSGSYNTVGHLYRDTLNVINLAIESQYYFNPKVFIGGGAILGTISDVTWETTEGISSSKDDYKHTFTLADNFGYEVYAGLDFLGFSKLTLGFAHKQGLSMNYGLETLQNGMIKYRQPGSDLSEELWETMGIFMRATIAF